MRRDGLFDDAREQEKPDYNMLAARHARFRPYDVSCGRVLAPPLPKCCICHKRTVCTTVFFPCEHMPACAKCIKSKLIGPVSKARVVGTGQSVWKWCPLCQAEIKFVDKDGPQGAYDRFQEWVYS